MPRTFIIISVPDNFIQKLMNFLHNINAINSEIDPPIIVEEVFKKKEDYAAVPKERG
jgi:hypothetical protein